MQYYQTGRPGGVQTKPYPINRPGPAGKFNRISFILFDIIWMEFQLILDKLSQEKTFVKSGFVTVNEKSFFLSHLSFTINKLLQCKVSSLILKIIFHQLRTILLISQRLIMDVLLLFDSRLITLLPNSNPTPDNEFPIFIKADINDNRCFYQT
jgi:hypothetical protein